MSKFTCLVLCAVAVSLSSVFAGQEERDAFREAMMPILLQCSKEQGVTEDEIMKAKEGNSVENMKPCFLGCVFKKMAVMNDKGEYDVDTSLTSLKEYVKDDNEYAKFTEIGKQCESVNDEAVSDGEAGCERAALLAACITAHRGMVF